MARPHNPEMRSAIVEAAIVLIAQEGVNAPTAAIARAAGVAQGSLFAHFKTKTELINAVFLLLKEELAATVLGPLSITDGTRERFRDLWSRYLAWGTSRPARRRALAQLSVSDLITQHSRALSLERSAAGIAIVREASAGGLLKEQSIALVGNLVDAFAGAAIDHIIRNPDDAQASSDATFEALWRALN
jgi:AcrR family transcriptional regulator